MKAAVLEKIGGPLSVAEVGLTPLSRGQVLVKVQVAGICGSQLQEIAGYKGNEKFLPHLMGHEGAGIVEKVGEGVTTVQVGDKVVMHWRKGAGIESDFPKYVIGGVEKSSGMVNTFCEYAIVSENRVTAVPQDTPDELCALLGCSLSTALGTINSEAKVQKGESVLIVGAGGLGANLIKAAKLAGASPVISIDVHENKRDWVKKIGADLYINTATENLAEVLASAGIKGVDVIVDTSGAKRAIESTLPLLSGKGRYILLGQPKPGETIELQNAIHFFGGEGKSIKATQGGKFDPAVEIPRYLKLYKEGALTVDDLITHRISLDEINKGIDLLRSGHAARILIDIAPSAGQERVGPSKDLRAAYSRMLALRVSSEELVKHYLDNKVFSMVHFYVGQEAVAVGVCDALEENDLAMGTHRSHGYYLAKGGSFRKLAAELFGRITGAARGKGGSMHMVDRSVGFAGTTPLLGSVAPIAAGQAFAKKFKKEKGIVAAFYGDGASEEGVVYETYNLAALYKVPLLLVLENNSWSINSNIKNRRAENYDIEKVATGLGMRFMRADGNNYEDVLSKARTLAEGIRRGEGPAVLECMVYRHMAHSTPLMEESYRTDDTLERRVEADSLKRLKNTLLASGVSEVELDKEEAQVRERVRSDIAWALTQPYPQKEELGTDVYA